MRVSFLAVCGTAAVMLVSAMAEKRPTPRLHPDSLARVEAITTYCEKADPTSETEYAAKLAGLTRGHSDQEILRDRGTSRYQQAMTQAHQTLARVSFGDAVQACSEFLADN
jgi:hypothetical protein